MPQDNLWEGAIPYARNQDLPTPIKTALPDAAQTLFRRVANANLNAGKPEKTALQMAWGSVRQQYKKPISGGKWIHKAYCGKLSARRPVENSRDILAWAKSQGFKSTLKASELHVTLAYSKAEVEWPEAETEVLKVVSSKNREVCTLGKDGAVVLKFDSPTLQRRFADLCEEHGCSWDHENYEPHITISYDASDLDLSKVKAYSGPIELGPEVLEDIIEDWDVSIQAEEVVGKFLKVDRKLGLAFGWAIISKVEDEEYFDLQNDHIPEEAMLEAATDFMLKRRTMKLMHKGQKQGEVVFAWPLTSEIAKAMGIKTHVTGLMVAVKPTNKKILDQIESGALTGFSIGGERLEDEELVDAA